METFKTIINNAEAEIVEKRSKFIANIYYIDDNKKLLSVYFERIILI